MFVGVRVYSYFKLIACVNYSMITVCVAVINVRAIIDTPHQLASTNQYAMPRPWRRRQLVATADHF